MDEAQLSDFTDSAAWTDALAAAAEAYRPRLLAAAERILRDPGDAEDAVQDALVAALRSQGRFRGEARPSSWLYRITINCALMRLRQRRRRPAVGFDDLPLAASELAGDEPTPDERFLLRERLEETGARLARLSPVQREAVLLRGVHELSVAEVAGRIGRSAAAAKMLLHRARESMRSDPRAA
jgi:RNA polymerase sigma-70 factor, ECF subfamily